MRKSAPPPPYSSGNGRPKRPSSPIFEHGLDGKHLVAVPVGGVRSDLRVGELAHDVAELLLLRASKSNSTVATVLAAHVPFVRVVRTCLRIRARPVSSSCRSRRGGASCATARARSSRRHPRTCASRTASDGFARPRRDRGRRLLGRVPRVRPRPRDRARARPRRRRPLDPRPRARALRRPARHPRRRRPRVVGDAARVATQLDRRCARGRRSEELDGAGRPRAWTSSLDRVDHADAVETIHGLLDAGECYQVNLTRRLTCAARARSDRALRRARPAEPGAARRAVHVRPEAPDCPPSSPRRPSCSCASSAPTAAATSTRPIKGTAADARDARGQREGPRRERDDRRPRAQRSRTRVRVRIGAACPRSSRSRRIPGLFHLVSTIEGPPAPRRRSRRPRARDVPARVDHRRAEAARDAGDRRPRARAPRRVLRRDRLDRRRPRRVPSSRSRSARSRSRAGTPTSASAAGSSPTPSADDEWARPS